MAFDGKLRILHAHAGTVVRHTHEARAARHDFHFNLRSPRIDGIFHEFLDDGGGAFHDFTRCNFIDRIVVEYMNPAHRFPSSPFTCCCKR